MVRGTVGLPAARQGSTVAVFAQGDRATAAREAGGRVVAEPKTRRSHRGRVPDFDVAIASPDLMPLVGKLVARSRRARPDANPKTGTVTDDVAKAVTEFKGRKVEYRTDRYGQQCTYRSARSASTSRPAEELLAVSRSSSGPSRVVEGQVSEEGRRFVDHGPRGQNRHRCGQGR